MYVSLVAKFKEIIDWKRNKFVPKCIASQLNRSAFINRKCMVAQQSHDLRMVRWQKKWNMDVWLLQPCLILVKRGASCLNLYSLLDPPVQSSLDFHVRFPWNHRLFQQNDPIRRTVLCSNATSKLSATTTMMEKRKLKKRFNEQNKSSELPDKLCQIWLEWQWDHYFNL